MSVKFSEAELYFKRPLVKFITIYCGKNTSGPVFFVLTITSRKLKTKDYNIAAYSRFVIFFFFTDYRTVLMRNDDVIGPSSFKQ
jgi:lipopolysaccharide biosynthesis glycosyltransferase